MVGRRTHVTAEQRACLTTVQASVQVEVRIEMGHPCDLPVLVTHHMRLVDELTARYDAVRLVEGQRTHRTLEEIRMADSRRPSNALTPRTDVKGASKALCLSLVKREKPVSSDAR